MEQLSFDRVSWRIGGRRAFLVSGEIHYFRLPRSAWRDRLQSLRDAGGTCVATYTPWLMHEPEEGRYDFTGDLDLEHFLDLCAEIGLHAMVRPGPYQYSELACDGLPGWLCLGHPELRAQRLDGSHIRESSMSYNHPGFLALTRRWFDRVLPLIAAHQTTRGGAVAAVQFDNELIGIHEWFGSWDYHPEAMGVGRDDGAWAHWLGARHGSLAAANSAYATSATSWAALRPVERAGDAATTRLFKDYMTFYYERIADYGVTLAGWMRQAGIDVPLIHNSASPYMNASLRPLAKRLGSNFVLGGDHYYNLSMDWDQNHPTPKYVSKCAYSLAQMDANGHPPSVFEMPGGSASDWPPITPHDAGCAYLANLAWGMKGWNYYVFAGGWNRPGTGTTGVTYDYGAGVAPDGTRRALWQTQHEFHAFCEHNAWLAGAEAVIDHRIALVHDHATAHRWHAERGKLGFSTADAWAMMRKGPWITAACAGLSPGYLLLDGDVTIPTDLPLVLCCGPSLPQAVQRQVAAFLAAGGRLLLAPMAPWLDEDLRPCRILADAIGADPAEPVRNPSNTVQLTAYGVPNVFVSGTLLPVGAVPPGAERTAVEEVSQAACGWERSLPGGGRVALLGLHWIHQKREHAAMYTAALTRLGLARMLSGGVPELWAILRTDGTHCALFVYNGFTSPATGRWTFAHPSDGRTCDTGDLTVAGASVRVWMP